MNFFEKEIRPSKVIKDKNLEKVFLSITNIKQQNLPLLILNFETFKK